MLELLTTLCLSAFSAGIFLRIKWNTMLPAVGIGMLAESAAFLLGRDAIPLWGCFALGLLCTAVFMTVRETRPFVDGFLAFCIGGCQLGLWTTFRSGFNAGAEGSMVLFVYCLFFALHIPAVLLNYKNYRLPRGWQVKTGGMHNMWVPILGAGMLILVGMDTVFPADGIFQSVIRILLSTAIFWLSLSVMVLLVMWGQKREQSTAEGAYHSDVNALMNMVRSQRHDYNLHVQTVASLIAQQKWDECRGYVNALVQDTSQMNDVLPVKDPAVAGLIHNYRLLAEQSGHTLSLDIWNDMSEVVTSAYETNKIIGNLLQNALDELSHHRQPGKIDLAVFKRWEYCLVCVSNRVQNAAAFSQRQEEIFHQGFTTKQGHDGVGLSSIRTIARQAGGDVTVWLEGDTVHFVASIPMRLAMAQ